MVIEYRLMSVGNAFRELKDINVYPSVGMKRPHAQLKVNFGQTPFIFDIDDMIKVSFCCFIQCQTTTKVRQREREAISEAVISTSISNLHSQLDEHSFAKELVAQFFGHDGFVETAKAFADELQAESKALEPKTDGSHPNVSMEEDLDATNRQRK